MGHTWDHIDGQLQNYSVSSVLAMEILQSYTNTSTFEPHNRYSKSCSNNNNGPNGHLFYVGGDLMMRRGMLPIIMLPDGDLRIVLHLVPF